MKAAGGVWPRRRRGAARRRGFVLGVTGGVATGKSTAARFLAAEIGRASRRPVVLIEADLIGHEVIARGRPAWRDLMRAFGNGILRGDGSVDRRRLGPVVFADPGARRRLDAIVHPRLLRELGRLVRRGRASGAVVLVVAALLLEWSWRERLDGLVTVDAPRAAQLDRLRRSGFSRAEALARIRSQLDRRRKRASADWVLVNDGDRGKLRRQARAVAEELSRRLAEGEDRDRK